MIQGAEAGQFNSPDDLVTPASSSPSLGADFLIDEEPRLQDVEDFQRGSRERFAEAEKLPVVGTEMAIVVMRKELV